MTTYDDTSVSPSNIRVDGVSLETLAKASSVATPSSREVFASVRRFWASARRPISDRRKEIMEVSFGGVRLLNWVQYKVGRFPLDLTIQYLDDKGRWRTLNHGVTKKVGTRRVAEGRPVITRNRYSVPARVGSATATGHPQHFGKDHWNLESFRVGPVRTRKIRFILQRPGSGRAPRDYSGKGGRALPYSVALKDVRIGYRVANKIDLPPKPPKPPTPDQPQPEPENEWASSRDILGSRKVYSVYTQDAAQAVDGNTRTFWRSEPQPFPFAVVNLFLDVRTEDGSAPVIDRFWMDPVTVGPLCNVYYSDSEPTGNFEGSSDLIPDRWREEVGFPTVPVDGATNRAISIDLRPDQQAGLSVSNVYERMRYDHPWWVGLDARSLTDTADPNSRPLVSIGTTQIVQQGEWLRVISQTGEKAEIQLDPALHGLNTSYRLVVAYFPYDDATKREPYFRIAYLLDGFPLTEAKTSEVAITALEALDTPIKVGLHPDPESLDAAAVAIKGLVVKSESLGAEVEEWFLEEGAAYVADPATQSEDRGTAQNARLRIHPMFHHPSSNIFAAVGGPGDRFGEMEWVPVTRDYTLKRGYLHLPPTRAKYWKFEMTRLLPEVYENFVPVEREVLVFPPHVVSTHEELAGAGSNAKPSGVGPLMDAIQDVAYRDEMDVPVSFNSPDATKVLHVKDPSLAAKAAKSGWIWTYQPWHVGTTAPQFTGRQVHHYEALTVRHTSKVAFFAGIKELAPYRVDYTFDDDTPEYVEHMLDTAFIDEASMSGLEQTEGSLSSIGSHGEATSKALMSYRTVRGIQFATQETDSIQVLADSGVANPDRWQAYGDAELDLIGPGDLQVQRGWFALTWGDLERKYDTYGDMDGTLYGALEGNDPATGSAEGGVVSERYTPSGAGKVSARAKVSASTSLAHPIRLEIVAAATGQVVAVEEAFVQQGEVTTLHVSYAPGALTEGNTYEDLETTYPTYGDMEVETYGSLERDEVVTDLYVRVRQRGTSREAFRVHEVGLYDSPIAWYFSNDNGLTWWQAIDVRNNPHGVLLFPSSTNPDPLPEEGRALRWKAKFFMAGATVSALHIRPWYGTRFRTVDGAHSMEALGPNRSIYDNFPPLAQHPMWLDRFNPLEREPERPIPIDPFWRNLVPNPSGEGESVPFETTGGTVEVDTTWEGLVPVEGTP